MKTFYLVRHGQSQGNVGPIREGAESPLSSEGYAQAEFIAARCKKLPIQAIVSSTLVRASETARIIGGAIGKLVEYSDLLVERRRPSEQLGKPKDHPDSREIQKAMDGNMGVPLFRVSDEENFDDLKARATSALGYLLGRSEDNVLVVTHGYFMRALLACALCGPDLTAREARIFLDGFHMENTGITILCFDEQNQHSQWWLWVWNDHAHLG